MRYVIWVRKISLTQFDDICNFRAVLYLIVLEINYVLFVAEGGGLRIVLFTCLKVLEKPRILYIKVLEKK